MTFGLRPDGVSLTFQAGVETSNGTVADAFGQKGLNLHELAIRATFGLPVSSSELSVNADADLPASWTASSMPAHAVLAFKLAAKEPCFKFELGSSTAKPSDPPVVNIGKGLVTANYLKLLIAPMGCDVPTGGSGTARIAPGYGFAFVGAVVGSPMEIVVNVAFANNGLQIDGRFKTDKFDIYALALSNYNGTGGPDMTFDIDTSVNKYDIKVDAAVEVGRVKYRMGGKVAVQGEIRTSGDAFAIKLAGNGRVALGPIGATIKPLKVDVLWFKDSEKASQSHANVNAGVEVGGFGIYIGATADLVYANSQLERMSVSAVTGFDALVGKLQGRVTFDYCLGNLVLDRNTGNNSCTMFHKIIGASPAMRLSLVGTIRVLWWEDNYTWLAYDQQGAEGTEPVPGRLDPAYDPGPMPKSEPNIMSQRELEKHHDVITPNKDIYKAMYPKSITDGGRTYPACENVKLGTEWQPTADQPNPPVGAPDPHPGGPCGLIVSYSTMGYAGTTGAGVVCDATSCKNTSFGRVITDASGSAANAREQLIMGLRTPPGTVPAGSRLEEDVVSPDGKYALRRNGNGFALAALDGSNGGEGKVLWGARAYWNKNLTQGFLLKNGKLQADRANYASANQVVAGTGIDIADATKQPYLFVQDGMTVYYNQGQNRLWGVNNLGNCFPARNSCDATFTGEWNPYPDPKPVEPSFQTRFKSQKNGQCMGVSGASLSPGAWLIAWNCGAADQVATVYPESQTIKMQGRCLQGSYRDHVITADCTGKPNQKFVYNESTRQITSQGLCVDMAGGNTNGYLYLWECEGKSWQKWDRS